MIKIRHNSIKKANKTENTNIIEYTCNFDNFIKIYIKLNDDEINQAFITKMRIM